MQLVVILILSLVLALPSAPYPFIRSGPAVLAALAVATLIPPIFALLVTRRTLRSLEARPDNPEPGQDWLAWGATAVHLLLATGHGAALVGTAWINLCMRSPLAAWPTIGGMLVAAPFLASLVLTWAALYPADRAIRQIALETYLFRSRPVRPVWLMGEYLLFNFRHQVLFILIPMWAVLLVRDVLEIYTEPIRRLAGHAAAPDLLLGASALLVASFTPMVMRYVWTLRPLPPGPLRERLAEMCRRLNIRFRDILVWHSGGLVVNAAVVGILPRMRYVMFSDGLLEQLDDLKIEGVFGHELGHIKRRHIPYFLAFGFISGCLVMVVGQWAEQTDRATWLLLGAIAGAVLLFKWGVVFGWISRRFERQADVYGVRALAAMGVPCVNACALHRPEEFLTAAGATSGKAPGAARAPAGGDLVPAPLGLTLAPGGRRSGDWPRAPRAGDPLCIAAAGIFGQTLVDVAVLNGIPPEAPSFRHSSIASRARFVDTLARSPAATAAFERTIGWIKLGIVLAAGLSAVLAAWVLKLWTIVLR